MIYIPTPAEYPRLSAEEEQLPISKYYYMPMPSLDPVYERALTSGPIQASDIPTPDKWTDLVLSEGYNEIDFGYGMMENGAGYLSVYTVSPLSAEMTDWWFEWMGHRPKSMPKNQGNIRYKIWCPPDHYDCDHSAGCGVESLDLGQGDPKEEIYMHNLDPVDYGMSEQAYQALTAKGVSIRLGYETFDHPGTHITLHVKRPCKTGGFESFGREWIGYAIKDGKFVRDESTPVSEKYLRNIVIHNVLESKRLDMILPTLYSEYKDRPIDED